MVLFSKKIFTRGSGCLAALLSLSALSSVVNGQGCKGGNTFGYEGLTAGADECSCISTACTNDTCTNQMGGEWTDDCPPCDEDACDPLAANEYDDPICSGPPELIDRAGKKMYRRRVLEMNKPQDSEEGVFCYLKVELCEGETQVTQGMDSGFGDYYRLAATPEWYNYTGTEEYQYAGMSGPDGARSYSPATPMNENNVQFIIKEVTSGDGSYYDCTPGVDCQFGFSELTCMLKPGDEILLSKDPDHFGYVSTHLAYIPNFSREPGYGPYTINLIGQGVAITELNVLAISELLEPFRSDGNFSNIQTVNYLWANSYWSNAEWTWQETDSTDLARELMRDMAKYGIRFNLMHSISREQRPEAQYPRTDVHVIGEAFNLTNTTDQDPNIKWFVVGSSSYKNSIYPQITEWGFDMAPCPGAEKKGYPYCGTNALYKQLEPGADPDSRMRSELFQGYAEMEQVPNPPIEGLGQTECGICKSKCMETDPENPGPCKNMCHVNGLCEGDGKGKGDSSHDQSSDDHSSDDHSAGDDHDRVPGTEECGICKHACADNDEDILNSIFGDNDFSSSGACKGACQDLYGASSCMCGPNLCSESDDEDDSQDHSSHDHAGGETEEAETPSSDDHSSHDHAGSEATLSTAETACSNEQFTTLCSLIEACEVDFEGADTFTVFAPTDDAFAELDAAVGGLDTVDEDILCGILSFHVVAGQELHSDDLNCSDKIEMSNGINARIKCTKGIPYGIKGGGNDEAANFVDVDIMTTDGVIHTIDNVLFYPMVMGGSTTGDVTPSLRGIDSP